MRRLIKRDPRVLGKVKKMTGSGRGKNLADMFHVQDVWSTRASRALRLFLAPGEDAYTLLGFARRGDHRYFASEW